MSLAFLAARGRDKAVKSIVPLWRSALATVIMAVGMSIHFVCVAAEPKPPAPSASAQSQPPKDAARVAMFQSLRSVWQRQQSDIASAKIKLRLLHASVSEGTLPPGIPRGQLRGFLQRADLAASQDSLQELIAFCLIDLKSVTRSRMEHELLIAANRRRETAGKTLTVADGAQNICSRIGIVRPKEVRQIDLFPLGQGVEPLNLNDLRVVLWPKIATCVLDGSIKATRFPNIRNKSASRSKQTIKPRQSNMLLIGRAELASNKSHGMARKTSSPKLFKEVAHLTRRVCFSQNIICTSSTIMNASSSSYSFTY